MSVSMYAKQLNKSEFRHINAIIIIRFRNAHTYSRRSSLLTYTSNEPHARGPLPFNIHHSAVRLVSFPVGENPINDNVPLLVPFVASTPTPTQAAHSALSRIKFFGGHSKWKLFCAKLFGAQNSLLFYALSVCADGDADCGGGARC